MYFSIAAPQNVTLPDGKILSFRVNAQNSALCELHVVGVDGQDVAGTHILTFSRNGTPSDTSFVPTPVQPAQPTSEAATGKAIDVDLKKSEAAYDKQTAPTQQPYVASRAVP